ncbi:MAG: DUF1648 domain-containing protein [Burkholderiaceae bacterium]
MSHFAQQGGAIVPFLALVACAALFVFGTSQSLPNIVASHFGSTGQANGCMPRAVYMWFMIAIVAGSPLFTVFIQLRAFRKSNARLNIPNREYWLASSRRAETIEYLSRQSVRFSIMLMTFLCYAHWLVVQANKTVPTILPSKPFFGGLVVFLAATLVWVISLVGHFRNVQR